MTPDGITRIAHRYGVAPDAIRAVPGGVANQVYLLADHLVLRVPRATEFEADLRKEAGVIPVARALGVRTPAMVDFDDSRMLVDMPYAVIERVHGTEVTDAADSTIWLDLGQNLERLHSAPAQPIDGVPTDDGGDPWLTVDDLATRGYLDSGTARWLVACFDDLVKRFDRNEPAVLLHGDVAPQNVLVAADSPTLIDWGDAAWGPRGMEFAKLRLDHAVQVLRGYRHDPDGALEAATVWFHFGWGLADLTRPPATTQRHWTAPPAARLLGVLRFLASGPPSPWPGSIERAWPGRLRDPWADPVAKPGASRIKKAGHWL